MAATYDETDLDDSTSAGRLNVVRLLLQDTGPTTFEFQDEEINYFLSAQGDAVYDAAIAAARSAQMKYARLSVDRTVGDLSVDATARANTWAAAVKALQAAKQTTAPASSMPLVGNDLDADPNFALGMMDNPREDTGAF